MAVEEITTERPIAATPARPASADADIAENWRKLSAARHAASVAYDTHTRLYYDPMIARLERLPEVADPAAQRERFEAENATIYDDAERLGAEAYAAEMRWFRAPAPTVYAVVEKIMWVRDSAITIETGDLDMFIADLKRLGGTASLAALF